MNTYDFETVIPRRGTDSLKWSGRENELPMWVADMDFATAPEVLAAIQDRAAHGIFGYSVLGEAWYDAYIGWWQRRHGLTMERSWLLFCTGVIPAISSLIRALTAPGEGVVLQPPVYNMFFHCIERNGRRAAENPLRYENGSYSVDFEDLERCLAAPENTLMLLCSPHNPVGRIWDRETLERIGALCRRYGVTVISDEIHCDLTEPGRDYVPFASVSDCCRDNSITCLAPTKTFNLAGIKTAAVAVADPALRERVRRALDNDGVAEANAFAVPAAVAAFNHGAPWLDALRRHISQNRARTGAFLARELPEVSLVPGEATYLLWLDFGRSTGKLGPWLRREAGLWLSPGGAYGRQGENFLRMNIACPRATLEEGLERLRTGLQRYDWDR